MMHLGAVVIRSRAAGMLPSASAQRDRLWAAAAAPHVHDYQLTGTSGTYACTRCPAVVRGVVR